MPASIDQTGRILVVGAHGLIGSAIARVLAEQGIYSTQLLRREVPISAHHAVIYGDLSDRASLTHACRGQDLVINAASYVGPDPRQQHEVNAVGALNLVRAAEAANVSQILYVSSTSVYGGKIGNGSVETMQGLEPRSSLSVSRLAAEVAILDFGGVVLRPHLVYGPGDRFFLGPLLQAMRALGGWIEQGRARVSTISSDLLARLAVEAVTTLTSAPGGHIFHASHPQPMTVFSLVTRIMATSGNSIPLLSFDSDYALDKLARFGVSERQIAMVAADNWFNSEKIWKVLDTKPGATIEMSAASRAWYRSIMVSA